MTVFNLPIGTYQVDETILVSRLRGYSIVGTAFRAIYDELSGNDEAPGEARQGHVLSQDH